MVELVMQYGDMEQTFECDRLDLDDLYLYFDNEFAGGVKSPWLMYGFNESLS